MITQEELDVIHQFVLLTIARKVLGIDLLIIEKSSLKLKGSYAPFLRSIMDEIGKELALLKRFMHQHQLKITKTTNDGMFSHYEYVCRGYQSSRNYLNTHLKNQVHCYIQHYLDSSLPNNGAMLPNRTS